MTGIFQDPPDLFSDDGTLTPDPMREDGTDESPLQGMNNRNRTSSGIPTDKLKKIRTPQEFITHLFYLISLEFDTVIPLFDSI